MINHIAVAEALTKLLDEQFTIFGFRFGLDPILGLIPWFGDAVSFVISLYIVWIAHQLNVPAKAIRSMVTNLILDFVVGSIPVVGDAADFMFKANSRNLAILKSYARGDVEEGEIVG